MNMIARRRLLTAAARNTPRRSGAVRALQAVGALLLIGLGLLPATVQAQTNGVWTSTTGLSGNWSDPSNWQGGVVPIGGATTTLTFNVTTGTTVLNVDLGGP